MRRLGSIRPARVVRARTITLAMLMLVALCTAPAYATYGDALGLADSEGAMPGPKAFWAGTCDLTAPATEVGVAPANARDCLDSGTLNVNGLQPNPWTVTPAWRLAPVTQAGAHADATATFMMARDTLNESGSASTITPFPGGSARDLLIDLPPGLAGNPGAVPQCSNADFERNPAACPPETQVGVAQIRVNFTIIVQDQVLPVYNLVPLEGRTAEFGIPNVANLTTVRIAARARTDRDFGLTTGVERLPTGAPLLQQSLTFWGTPWAASHDIYRAQPNSLKGVQMTAAGLAPADQAHYDPSWGPIEPFISNPTACGAAPITHYAMDSWQKPAPTIDGYPDPADPRWVTADSPAPPVTGCDKLAFQPSVSAQPANPVADSPSGFDIDLATPQNNDAPGPLAGDADDASGAPAYFKTDAGLATSHLKDTVITLPKGVTVTPGAADGLGACSESEIGLTSSDPIRFNNADAACPDSSKIGTLQIDTPLLQEPVQGTVYLARQSENPFGSLLALYLVAQSKERALIVKLAGKVEPDASTGQLTATFVNNPQLPFRHLTVHFTGGPRAALATPATCGTFTTTSRLTSWSAPDAAATPSDVMAITQGPNGSCANSPADLPFGPGFSAGVTDPHAGVSPSFTTTVTRDAGQQNVSGLDVTLPPGLLASIKGVPQCAEAQAASGSCDASSQLGTATVAVGAGAAPLDLPQAGHAATAVYFAGPYKGAPFSLVIKVPAQAGPFDLGTVAVRAALLVDPADAHVTVKSDPLPQILQGIPVAYRTINVLVNRPGFMRNPTNCDAKSIGADIRSAGGVTARVASGLQVGDCASLPFAPKLAMALSGKGQTTDDKHPALTASLTLAAGQANTKKVKVTLPLSMALDPDNANGLCEPTAAVVNQCPAASIVGHATALSPILDHALAGPVYFVRGERTDAKSGRTIKTLPKLYVPLTGADGVQIDLHANSEVVADQLVTTFDNIPDAAVSDFRLDIDGGEHGILVVSRTDICKSTQVADVAYDGQNGRTADDAITMSTPCKLAIVGSSHTATALHLAIGGIGAGKVTVSGHGLAKAARSVATATVATLRPRLSKANRRALAQHRNVRVRVTVKFQPKGAAKAKTVHKTLIVHGAKKKKSGK